MKSIAIVLMTIAVIMCFTAITATAHPAFALSRFFNCMTELANSHNALTISDVDSCYSKEFH